MSENTTTETREQIEKRVAAAVRRSHTSVVPNNGIYAFAVTGENLLAKDKLSQGDDKGNGEGCRQIAVRVAPLEDPTEAGSARNDMEQTIWVTLAVPNADIPNHTVSGKAIKDMANEFVSLSDGRVPYVNKKLPEGGWDNSPEKEAEVTSQLTEATLLANEILAAVKGVKKLTGNIFYAKTVRKTGAKAGYFINGRSTVPPQKLDTLTEYKAPEETSEDEVSD